MIDLHTHSKASDGELSPADLLALAANKGLKALALTDHDTIKGLDEAEYHAEKKGIIFIRGIELEAEYPHGQLHILGLNLVKGKDDFEREIHRLQEKRHQRNLSILEKMNDAGISAEYKEIIKYSSGLVGRPHFAKYLLERGIVTTIQEAFDRFLGTGKPFYIPKETLPLEEILSLIHEGGGRPVLAHPSSLRLSLDQIEKLLPHWREIGLEGVEAYHPKAKPSYCRKLENMARRYGYFITAGSDFHGASQPERRLGRTTKKHKKISDSYFFEVTGRELP